MLYNNLTKRLMQIQFDCTLKKHLRLNFEQVLIRLCLQNNLIPPFSESGRLVRYKGIVQFASHDNQKKFYGYVANLRSGGNAWLENYSAN